MQHNLYVVCIMFLEMNYSDFKSLSFEITVLIHFMYVIFTYIYNKLRTLLCAILQQVNVSFPLLLVFVAAEFKRRRLFAKIV